MDGKRYYNGNDGGHKKAKTEDSIYNLINRMGTILRNSPDMFGDSGRSLEALIPLVVMVGNQSAGKTTLFKRIFSIMCPDHPELSLITGVGTATLFPIEIRFVYKENMEADQYYVLFNGTKSVFPTIQEMIKKVQEHNDFHDNLIMVANFVIPTESTQLTLVDLPGLIIPNGENNEMADKFKQITTYYASKPNSIVFNTVSMLDDIATCYSVGLLANIECFNKILIGTKVDSNNNPEMIPHNLNNLSGYDEICLTCATHEPEVEIQIINQKLDQNNNPKIKKGTGQICELIPKIAYRMIRNNISQMRELFKELNSYCVENLERIGYRSRDISEIRDKYIQSIKEITEKYFCTERNEINQQIDLYVSSENIKKFKGVYLTDTYKNKNNLDVVIDQKIKESINKRGKSFKDLVSIDDPVHQIIKSKNDDFNSFFLKFHNRMKEVFQFIIHEIIKHLDLYFGECLEITKILKDKWLNEIEQICSDFSKKIIKHLNATHQNPNDLDDGSCYFEKELLKEFLKKFKGTQMTVEKLHANLDSQPIFNDSQIAKRNSVKAFVKKILTKNIETHFSSISSNLKEMTDQLHLGLQEEIPKIIAEHRNSIKEPSKIFNQRRNLLELVHLIQELDNQIN